MTYHSGTHPQLLKLRLMMKTAGVMMITYDELETVEGWDVLIDDDDVRMVSWARRTKPRLFGRKH